MTEVATDDTRLPVHAHVLRHTYNAVAIRAEVGLVERAGLLNHSDTHTLKTYDHHLEGLHDAREAVRAAMREIRG